MECRREVVRCAEDRFGVIKGDPAGLRQHETSAAPFEQVVTKGGFQGLDLGGKRRLREVQHPGCARQRSIPCDRPKKSKMMKVQHGNTSKL